MATYSGTGNISLTFASTYSEVQIASFAVFNGSPLISQSLNLDSTVVTKVFTGSATIAAPATLDVTSLTDAFGRALNFGTVRAICFSNAAAATASLTVGGGSNPLFATDQYTIKAGNILPILSPFTVDGTHKIITLTPSASLTYQVLILGS